MELRPEVNIVRTTNFIKLFWCERITSKELMRNCSGLLVVRCNINCFAIFAFISANILFLFSERKRNQKRQKKDDDASLFEQEIKAFRQLFRDIQFCSSDENIKKEFVKELTQVRLDLYKKYCLKFESG